MGLDFKHDSDEGTLRPHLDHQSGVARGSMMMHEGHRSSSTKRKKLAKA
jgi:hypothetical protein